MRDVGRSADIAALGARRLADALDAQARAADAAAKADLSVAKANAILAVTEHKMNAERAAVTQKLQRSIDDASRRRAGGREARSEEHTSEPQSQFHLVCRLL